MNHRLVSLLVCALLAPTACDQDDGSRCDVVVPVMRRALHNGANLNGVSLNGTNLNGTNLNGTSMQGVSLDGLVLTQVASGGDVGSAHVELAGTSLRAVDVAGRSYLGAELVGARLRGRAGADDIELRITSVARDPADPSLEWYTLAFDDHSICADGGAGLFVRGVWDETGARHDTLADDASIAFTFSCARGAIAKCVAWGYTPEGVGIDAHQSCTRLARADYCGDGTAHTADGTLVDVFDVRGVMQPEPGSELEFEAGWTPDGATCVSRPRYDERDGAGRTIAIPCWDALPVCDDAEAAMAAGAILMSASAPQTLCHG